MTEPPSPPPTPPPVHPLVRWPARVVAVLVVLPLRALWDSFGACAGLVERFWDHWVARPWVAFWRAVGRLLGPVGRLLLVPLRWLHRRLVRPAAALLERLWQVLVLTPTLWLWRLVTATLGRRLLAPLGRALGRCWRWCGRILRAAGRVISLPLRWVHRTVVAPAARWGARWWVRGWRAASAPLRHAAREVRAQVARALGRTPR